MGKLIKHLPIALFIGAQAFVVIVICSLIGEHMPVAVPGGFAWVTFLGWSIYFMSGAQPYNGAQNFVSFIIGAIGAICMFELNKVFGFLGDFVALPLAVGLITVLMDLFEVGPSITQHVPSIFAGCATFIGILLNNPGSGYGAVFATQLAYLMMGSIFGWMSIAFSEWYNARN